jgi:hypothetical protein
MELHEMLRALCAMPDQGATVVSLALDVAKGRLSQPETRTSLTNQMLHRLGSEDHTPAIGAILRGIAGRISLYLDKELRAETEGLFLVAGPGFWQPFELAVPIRDFLHVGRKVYLAPLLEAFSRMPSAYVLQFDRQQGILEEVRMGARKEIGRFLCADLERDAQHQMSGHSTRSHAGSGRSATRTGGGGRDRFQYCVEDAVEAMLHKAADRVAALQQEAPSDSIYAFGDRMHFPSFRNRLPAALQSQVVLVAPFPHRHEELLGANIREQQESRVRSRIHGEILEFQTRRAEQCHVATGPEVILPLLDIGKVTRVFLDPRDPLLGSKCGSCAARSRVGREKCEACGNALVETSMTQEVLSHVLLHPPVSVTFVASGESWLEESDGMAALLSEKGIHSRR